MRDAGAALLVQQTWTTGLLTPMGWASAFCRLPFSLHNQYTETPLRFSRVLQATACAHPRAISTHFA